MVTVDDATYVAMRDKMYGGNDALAQRAKQKIESSSTQEQYDKFVSGLNSLSTSSSSTNNSQTSTKVSTPTTSNSNRHGEGNYTYNPTTGYYEKQPTQDVVTPTEQDTRKQEVIKQETPIKQQETVITTDTKNNQRGALTPASNEYYNQTSDEALNKIRDNLNQYRQTNPEYFSDYDSFKKNFSYDLRNDEQKNTLDTWYKGYEKGIQLSSVPTSELYTQYKDGSVSLSDLETLRISNPTKYAELQETINKGNIISAYDDDKGMDTTGMSMQDMAYQMFTNVFNTYMNGGAESGASKYFTELQDKMNSPEMMEIQDKTTELEEQIENLNDDRASIKKAVEKEYEGTGASRSKINAIIADRCYDLDLQLRTLNSEYNKYATQYNNRMNQYQNEFQLELQEYQINQQARQQQMSELGFAMDLMNFETPAQQQEREWNYWVRQQEYQNGNINSKDYQTRYKAALTSVQNLLSQYEGIPMIRSSEQMAQDVLKAIDSGSTLGAELTKINKQIQQKPEYKQVYNQTFGTSSQGFGKTVNIGGTDYVEYNGQLYTAEDFNKEFGNAISVSPEVMSQGLDTFKKKMQSLVATGGAIRKGWCGEPVNDYLKSIGSNIQYDNDLQTKLDSITPGAGPKVGSIAIWDGSSFNSPDAKKYGHVAIVTGVDEKNGTITVLESNGQAHKMGMGYGKYNMANVTGYYDPSAGYSSSDTTNTKSVGGLNDKQLTQLAKDYINGEKTYSDIKATYGEDVLNAVGLRAANLADEGYEKSTKITDPAKQASMEEKLRKEYDKAVSDAQETIDWVNKMQEAYNLIDTNKNAASQAIVIAYNKLLDPGSVVREGEYARSAEGQSKLKQIQAKLEQFASGGAGLTKDELKSLVDVANAFSTNAKQVQKNAADRTMVSINKYGLTPEAILPLSALNQINTTTQKGIRRGNFSKTSSNTTMNNGSGIQNTNFYQTYANTAPSNNKKYVVNGVEIDR